MSRQPWDVPEWRQRLGQAIRTLSYRIDGRARLQATHWTFTYGENGVEFHDEPMSNRRQKGCRLWYSDADYDLAFAASEHKDRDDGH